MIIVVQACPGRESLTVATLESLDKRGGAESLDVRKVLFWTGVGKPAVRPPLGWETCHCDHKPQGHRRDLWRIFRDVVGADDTLIFEDDIVAGRNVVPYMAGFREDCFATFFRMPATRPLGRQPVDPVRGFWGTQAFRVPARLVQRFIAAGDTDPRPTLRNEGGDTRIGHLLHAWREPIYYHRSLVQHVGYTSVHNPKATLTGLRAPAADFDPEHDPSCSNGSM